MFNNAGIPYCGPMQRAAYQTEGSKVEFKDLCRRLGIRTADYEVYPYEKIPAAFTSGGFIATHGIDSIVVKADGLFAGKGVFLPKTAQDVYDGCHSLWKKSKVNAAKFVIELKLPGPEYSCMGITDGKRILHFPTARDYKRRTEDPESPNTGGMGAFTCPMPEHLAAEAREIMQRIVDGLREEGSPYRGFIYVGFMVGSDGHLYVLECNCRLGDPETQAILFSMDGDLGSLCLGAALGDLSGAEEPRKVREAVCIVLASPEYPEPSSLDVPVKGIVEARGTGALVFHGSTSRDSDGVWRTSRGGRVLCVVGTDEELEVAREKAKRAAERITFDGVDMSLCYRTDIAG
jgi:phosphoribosylamine--glycine ligase